MKKSAFVAIPALMLALAAGAAAQSRPYRGTYIPHYAFPITAATSLAPESNPAVLRLDASQVWRGVIHATETIPVQPGAFTLVYPEWVPGEHGPTGPIDELAALRITANGKPLAWARDPVEMYSFHIDVPAGTNAVIAQFDVLMNDGSGVMATRSVAVLNWNRALLYQQGVDSHTYFIKPSIKIPANWTFATALTEAGNPGQDSPDAQFQTLSLAMLVDSPLDTGRYEKKWDLGEVSSAPVELDAFAANPRDLAIPAALLDAYKRLPAEAFALYGSRHFANYHALLTLSDQIGFEGIEHHQSSDNRAPDDFMINPAESVAEGDLVPHEFSHSWNGKYRRPADLATPNFQVPMRTDLLWVYEGMNQYLGDMLSFRTGIREEKDFPDYLAAQYAQMATEPGRSTTPVAALTTAAPFLYQATNQYSSISRTAGDFYTEGELVWLDADTIIRTLSHGTKSLDTFLHLYSQPTVTDPMTDTYTRAQIEALLNQVQPYDWHRFFQTHIYEIAPQPPADALTRAGWKLVYTAEPNSFLTAAESVEHGDTVRWYDLGATLTSAGVVKGLRQDSPAWNAGLAQGQTIVAVDHRSFSADELKHAIEQAQHNSQPIELEVAASGRYETLSVDYHDGLRNPHLERIPGTTDLLAQIAAPHTGAALP
jgi:predicted metalloprotease with PDZ domain